MAKFCSECGKPVENDWIVCPYCSNTIYHGPKFATGQKSDDEPEPTPEASTMRITEFDSLEMEEVEKRLTKPQQRALMIGIIIVIAAIVIPIASIGVLYSTNSGNNSKKAINFYVNNGLTPASYTVSIPKSTLDYYYDLSHPYHNYTDGDYVATIITSYCTPNDGNIIKIAQAVRSKCRNQSDSEEVINALLSFTQAIGYKSDVFDLCKYPLETIFKEGDCEDLSVLFGSLVVSLGFDTIIIIIDMYDEIDDEWYGHACAGLYLSFVPTHHSSYPPSYYFDIDSKNYWICETTSQGWGIGALPVSEPGYFLMIGYDNIT